MIPLASVTSPPAGKPLPENTRIITPYTDLKDVTTEEMSSGESDILQYVSSPKSTLFLPDKVRHLTGKVLVSHSLGRLLLLLGRYLTHHLIVL